MFEKKTEEPMITEETVDVSAPGVAAELDI